jgi:mycothiol synthase
MTSATADAIRPAIPGMSLRHYRAGDGAAMAALENANHAADGIHWRTTAAEMENWYSRPSAGFDATRDVLVVELDGRIVAETNVARVDTTDGLREYRIGCTVHPDLRRRGIGRWLQRLSQEAAATRLRDEPSERPAVTGSWCPERSTGKVALLEQEGYHAVRFFFDMDRPNLEGIVLPPMPDGLEVRPVPAERVRDLWDADVEAFLDHWGGFEATDARFETWRSDPKFDPSLHVVAWDGDQIAGGVINEVNEAENAESGRRQGWLASVFVRRPWRRRGLARALVMRSLAVLRDRGLTSAGLGVDADNENAALRLYVECGFEVTMKSTAYRKSLVLDA